MRRVWMSAGSVALVSAAATAQPLSWNNPAGGAWNTAGNWSPVQIPGSFNDVQIGLAGAYSIRTALGVSSCNSLFMTNPQAVVDVRMGETLRLGTSSSITCRVDGTMLLGDGQFGNPAVLDAGGTGSVALTGSGRIVLNARRELVLPFATIRASSRPVSIASTLRVEGRGALQASITCGGTIAPGLGPGGVGEMAIDSLVMSPTGVLEFDIGGPSFTDFDRIQINFGNSTRGGTLRVRLVNGFTPPTGMTFSLSSGALFGSFAAVDAPGFVLEPLPSSVVVRYVGVPCDPDYNADGNVDQDDVAYLVNVVGGGGNPSGADPDFNRDGNADQDDVAVLINVIAGAPCP